MSTQRKYKNYKREKIIKDPRSFWSGIAIIVSLSFFILLWNSKFLINNGWLSAKEKAAINEARDVFVADSDVSKKIVGMIAEEYMSLDKDLRQEFSNKGRKVHLTGEAGTERYIGCVAFFEPGGDIYINCNDKHYEEIWLEHHGIFSGGSTISHEMAHFYDYDIANHSGSEEFAKASEKTEDLDEEFAVQYEHYIKHPGWYRLGHRELAEYFDKLVYSSDRKRIRR